MGLTSDTTTQLKQFFRLKLVKFGSEDDNRRAMNTSNTVELGAVASLAEAEGSSVTKVIQRCKKGNRECVYPEPTPAGKSGKSSKVKGFVENLSSGEEDVMVESNDGLPTIPDDGEEDVTVKPESAVDSKFSPESQSQSRENSYPPSLTADEGPSPSTENSGQPPSKRPVPSRQQSRQTVKVTGDPEPDGEITSDMRFYLDYYKNNITCHHYAMKYDAEHFYTKTLLEMTQKNAALLYAIVGFAAYHHTLGKPNGKLAGFLKYYHESEVLGDWGNLKGHINAARHILTTLYTPVEMQKSNSLRKTLQWYVRFDLFLALQTATRTSLGHEWLVAQHEWLAAKAIEKPDDIAVLYEERFAYSRLLAGEYAILFDKDQPRDRPAHEFESKVADLMQKFARWPSELNPTLTDPRYLINKFSGVPALNTEIVDPYEPRILYGPERWVTNLIMIDIWAIELMFHMALSQMTGVPTKNLELIDKAYKSAQLFEAIELYPGAPLGAIIDAQASFALGCLLLDEDERTKMWCRQKLATIEMNGYIYPRGFRERMTAIWGTDMTAWWLPDVETCPPIIKELRNFTAERNSVTSEDLETLQGVFGNLRLTSSRKRGKQANNFGYDGVASPEFTFGSEGSSEPAFEDSPLRWDHSADGYTGN
ncbi:hypothetical protein EJ05DRAFT_495962 [Pseudovirgaria hyperparasitica]|uniref:Uncharacterized protein n=1 Tax=Pseudovirgaria hyperparasitica TaxID=470096 RepID=A0A6A6WLP3_9PEZI|nr:uncharacterized protein EJ05DRAFT_495962 [Pseudovirgaria hyperparasitica]KAF2763125.1 hypothetical protein EJ05DRAFT_495962 [Pseudovirgaria hyperparasitica]